MLWLQHVFKANQSLLKSFVSILLFEPHFYICKMAARDPAIKLVFPEVRRQNTHTQKGKHKGSLH